MKQNLITLALVLTLGIGSINAAPKHRHHAQPTVESVKIDTTDNGVEAYSDTTSYNKEDSINNASINDSFDEDFFDDDNTTFEIPENVAKLAKKGIMAGVVIVVCFMLFIILPIIILIFILLRNSIKRHNARVDMERMAQSNGQSMQQPMHQQQPMEQAMQQPRDNIYMKDNDYQWRRGVRNVSIGVGLMLLFWFINANALAGIGALILCCGLGQMFIAHSAKRDNQYRDYNGQNPQNMNNTSQGSKSQETTNKEQDSNTKDDINNNKL